ncbi:DUF4160 domain-containing protein, partial [Eggerthella sinensis]|uniref:DUF4160 domain-containing protein n=1 Tax=Eggerthella sinensis TaxID=242230 RepID=UPI00248DEF73
HPGLQVRHQRTGPPDHIHAKCAGFRASIGFDGRVLSGELPFKKLTLVRAWIVLHREELEADWALLGEGREAFRIEPLR